MATSCGLPLGRAMAGAGVLLALAAVTFVLAVLAAPAPGLAAAPPVPKDLGTQHLNPSAVLTHTAYIPFISRPDDRQLNVWFAEYYANMDLSGAPVRTAEEVRVDYDWGKGAPAGLPNNYFSVRWTGNWHFETGRYTFWIDADDGVRLWLDDDLLIDAWQTGRKERSDTLIVPEGIRRVRLEYYNETGSAHARLHWRRTDLYPRWDGDYYRQPWAEGQPLYSQVDDAIQFEWGLECPTGLACSDYSVVWGTRPVFITGTHRIYLYADDGYQLHIDGGNVQEGGWYAGQDGGGEDDYYQLEVNQIEGHDVQFKFHNRGGLSEARLWIQDMEHPYWKVEYWNNEDLAGNPAAVKTDPVIFYDWKWDKPNRWVYSDHFSVRWSGQRHFHAGFYRFGLFADDGVRLWVDGELLVDEWEDGRGEYYAPVTYLSTGEHELIVEYYEDEGEAEVRFWW